MKYRFIPISLQIIVPNVGTHANIILIDSKKRKQLNYLNHTEQEIIKVN